MRPIWHLPKAYRHGSYSDESLKCLANIKGAAEEFHAL
jgi:hypothetical protein